jgi:hypothetical protein
MPAHRASRSGIEKRRKGRQGRNDVVKIELIQYVKPFLPSFLPFLPLAVYAYLGVVFGLPTLFRACCAEAREPRASVTM